MPSMSLYIPDMVRQNVIEYATEVERSVSWVVTRAISEYLDKQMLDTPGYVQVSYEEIFDEDEDGPALEADLKERAEASGMTVSQVLVGMVREGLGR